MTNLLKKIFATFIIVSFMFISTGCDDIVIGTNLQKGDKYYAKGDYQKAYEFYMKAAQEYQGRLGQVYSNKDSAKEDAGKIVEAYCKAGLTAEKLAMDADARAMFEKAIKDSYAVKESYYVKEEIQVPAGYADRWIPATTKQVFVDGQYQDVWVDGGTKDVWVDGHYEDKQVWVDKYKEIYVDGYYKQDGTFVKGYYKKVKDGGQYKTESTYVDGYYKKEQLAGRYEKVWKDGYYKNVVVDGHYEKVFEPAHIEYKDIYKERDVTVSIDSPYIVQAKSKLPAASTSSTAVVSTENDPALKAAYEKMTLANQSYIKAGAPAKGAELETLKAAQAEYQKLLEAKKTNN